MIAVGRRGLPTSAAAELDDVARRTRVLRLALALAALGLLVVTAVAARGLSARPTSYFATGGGGIVVLDLSTSVDPQKYRRVRRVLTSLSQTATRVGLVVFSDTAYEAFPPGTHGEELQALIPFFETGPGGFRARQRPGGGRESPWTGTFRGGTRISTGLREARRMIERDGIARPGVLLISDLDDSAFDTAPLTQELIRYEAQGFDLRVVPLFPAFEDRDLFERLAGPETFVRHQEIMRNSAVEERQTLVGAFPTWLALAAAALLGLLALNERLCARVAWGRAR